MMRFYHGAGRMTRYRVAKKGKKSKTFRGADKAVKQGGKIKNLPWSRKDDSGEIASSHPQQHCICGRLHARSGQYLYLQIFEDNDRPAQDHDDEAVGDESEDEDEGHEPAIDGDDEGEGTELGRGVHRVAGVRRQTPAESESEKQK